MSNKNVKWLFFDLGSTLVDEGPSYRLRVLEAIEGSDVTFEEFDSKRKKFAEDLVCGDKEAAAYYGLTLKPWRCDVEDIYDGVKDLLIGLRNKGYRLGVVANQLQGTEQRMTKWGIIDYFDFVIASYEAGVSKPDQEIFLMALDKAGCKPNEAYMIGDRLDNDILPAKKLGIKTIWVRQGVVAVYQNVPSPEYAPDLRVDNVLDLIKIL